MAEHFEIFDRVHTVLNGCNDLLMLPLQDVKYI